jgi:hypothetical protein
MVDGLRGVEAVVDHFFFASFFSRFRPFLICCLRLRFLRLRPVDLPMARSLSYG